MAFRPAVLADVWPIVSLVSIVGIPLIFAVGVPTEALLMDFAPMPSSWLVDSLSA
jgi:hypothetical protein